MPLVAEDAVKRSVAVHHDPVLQKRDSNLSRLENRLLFLHRQTQLVLPVLSVADIDKPAHQTI